MKACHISLSDTSRATAPTEWGGDTHLSSDADKRMAATFTEPKRQKKPLSPNKRPRTVTMVPPDVCPCTGVMDVTDGTSVHVNAVDSADTSMPLFVTCSTQLVGTWQGERHNRRVDDNHNARTNDGSVALSTD